MRPPIPPNSVIPGQFVPHSLPTFITQGVASGGPAIGWAHVCAPLMRGRAPPNFLNFRNLSIRRSCDSVPKQDCPLRGTVYQQQESSPQASSGRGPPHQEHSRTPNHNPNQPKRIPELPQRTTTHDRADAACAQRPYFLVWIVAPW